jgi:hypothetical protein
MFMLEKGDLQQLRDLALREHDDFFKRNPHLKRSYHNSLIGICLCQGAALHYLDHKTGIADFDIWHFYLVDDRQNFPYRAHKVDKQGYRGIKIDYLKRAIPRKLYLSNDRKPEKAIVEFIRTRKTKTKTLLDKAIIGLYPADSFGTVFWPKK